MVKMRKRLTKKQAERLLKVSLRGSCAGRQIPEEVVRLFLEKRDPLILKEYIPVASKKIAERINVFSKIGARDPVLAYFLTEHNKKADERIKAVRKLMAVHPSKEAGESLSKLKKHKAYVGVVKEVKGNKAVVELPNGKTITAESPEIREGFVIVHNGVVVDSLTKREYKKYSKLLLKQGL